MERKSIDFYNEKGYEYLKELLINCEDLHGFIKRNLSVSLPMFTLNNTVKMFGYTNIYAYIPEYTEDYNKKKPLGIIEMDLDGNLLLSEELFDAFRDNLPKSTKLEEINILQSRLNMLRYFPINDRSEMVLRIRYSNILDKIYYDKTEDLENEMTILLCIMSLAIPEELYNMYEYIGQDLFSWYYRDIMQDRSMYCMLDKIVDIMKKRVYNYQF